MILDRIEGTEYIISYCENDVFKYNIFDKEDFISSGFEIIRPVNKITIE